MFEQATHIYLSPVRTARAGDFEKLLLEKVAPAVRAQRPELDGRWHLLKATGPADDDESVITYAFVFDGGDLDDWDLNTLLPAHYGEEEAARLFTAWDAAFVPRSQWAAMLAGGEEEDAQIGWTFTTVV